MYFLTNCLFSKALCVGPKGKRTKQFRQHKRCCNAQVQERRLLLQGLPDKGVEGRTQARVRTGRGASIAAQSRRALQQAAITFEGDEDERSEERLRSSHGVCHRSGLALQRHQAPPVFRRVKVGHFHQQPSLFIPLCAPPIKAIECHTQDLKIAQEVGDRKTEGVAAPPRLCPAKVRGGRGCARFHAAAPCLTPKGVAGPESYTSVTSQTSLHSRPPGTRRLWMREFVRRRDGCRLPSMVVIHLHTCTWYVSQHTMLGNITRRCYISKGTSHGMWNGDVALAPGVRRRGARTRRCSRAAAAV